MRRARDPGGEETAFAARALAIPARFVSCLPTAKYVFLRMSEPRLPGCTVIDHPLVKVKVTILRNKETQTELFRRTLQELTALLAFEATRELELSDVEIETPLEPDAGGIGCPGS